VRSSLPSFLAFGAYGLFWGTWGAALPALRDAAGLSDAELGVALLFVGLGGLPAMLFTGRTVDHFGARVTGVLLVALAVTGAVAAILGRDLVTLSLGMLLVGAASGAADVAQNALAGFAEQRSGRRTITVAHAVFSSFVVIGSLGAGGLRSAGADAGGVFAVAGVLLAGGGLAVWLLGDRPVRGPGSSFPSGRVGRRWALPFVVVGLVGALGFAVENAHQSWSAIFLADELAAPPALAAVAPATFAVFAALTRFAAGLLTRIPSAALLPGGAALAVLGTLILSAAHTLPLALAGLALAAVGTSVLYPTLLSRATRDVPADRRGRATAAVATTSYLGFVAGPMFVGVLAAGLDLRGAMIGVAALAVAFAVLAPLVTRRAPAAGRPVGAPV
jgi:MFS family permease